MGSYVLWRKRVRGQGQWEMVTDGLSAEAAQVNARASNAEAVAEQTGWMFAATPGGEFPR